MPPSEVSGEVPPELDGLVMRALAKDPDDRFQTAEEMRGLIQYALQMLYDQGSHTGTWNTGPVTMHEGSHGPGFAGTAALPHPGDYGTTQIPAPLIPPYGGGDDGGFEGHGNRGGGRGKLWILAVFALIAIAAGVALALKTTGNGTGSGTGTTPSPTVSHSSKNDGSSEQPSDDSTEQSTGDDTSDDSTNTGDNTDYPRRTSRRGASPASRRRTSRPTSRRRPRRPRRPRPHRPRRRRSRRPTIRSMAARNPPPWGAGSDPALQGPPGSWRAGRFRPLSAEGPQAPHQSVALLFGLFACHIGGRLRPALHSQFGQQARHIILDRFLGEVQSLADLAIGEPFADQVEDSAFLVGEAGEPASSSLVPPPSRSLSRTRAVATGSSKDFPAATSRIAVSSSWPRMALRT